MLLLSRQGRSVLLDDRLLLLLLQGLLLGLLLGGVVLLLLVLVGLPLGLFFLHESTSWKTAVATKGLDRQRQRFTCVR